MSAATDIAPPTADVKSGRMIGTLAAVSMAAGMLIVFVFQATAPRIALNRKQALERAVFTVLPGAVERVSFAWVEGRPEAIAAGAAEGERLVYAGYAADGSLVGVALPAAAQGYQDIIRILYGYDPARQVITGITVLESKETPGLGDKIAKDPTFLANFKALDVALNTEGAALMHPLELMKPGEKVDAWQVDGISGGATISSRAIVTMLQESTATYLPGIHANAAVFARTAAGGTP
jgi:electron transport complex protein RnfG